MLQVVYILPKPPVLSKGANMNKTKSPCIDCTKREVGCHGRCGEYMDFKERMEQVKKRRNDEHKRNYSYKVIYWNEV